MNHLVNDCDFDPTGRISKSIAPLLVQSTGSRYMYSHAAIEIDALIDNIFVLFIRRIYHSSNNAFLLPLVTPYLEARTQRTGPGASFWRIPCPLGEAIAGIQGIEKSRAMTRNRL